MARIREEVDIEAPPERVWAVVQEDAVHAPRWSTNLARVEKLDSGEPRVGTRYRYHLDLPGGIKETLEVEQSKFVKPKHCSGTFIRGPLKGTWGYTYTTRKGSTHVVYEMDYELGGLLRFAGGLLSRQYAEGIRQNMSRLKEYVESGKGPRVGETAPARKPRKS
jgi:uncharacterized protein YndB with AHSA1/START domain